MADNNQVTEKQLEQARGQGPGEAKLQIGVSETFLQWVNVESARRGMSNRDWVIESLLNNGQYEF